MIKTADTSSMATWIAYASADTDLEITMLEHHKAAASTRTRRTRSTRPDAHASNSDSPAASPSCQRFVGSDGYLICHRCGSLWSPLLHGTGWLPLSCTDRPAVPEYD